MIDINSPMMRERLISYCNEYNIDIDKDQATLLLKHLDLVLEKNKVMNLTRVIDIDDALILHILDSLLLCKLDIDYSGSFLDIGTGAGYPGIPFGIYTKMNGVLLDSVGKKITAVNEFLKILKLDKQIVGIHERVEEFANLIVINLKSLWQELSPKVTLY